MSIIAEFVPFQPRDDLSPIGDLVALRNAKSIFTRAWVPGSFHASGGVDYYLPHLGEAHFVRTWRPWRQPNDKELITEIICHTAHPLELPLREAIRIFYAHKSDEMMPHFVMHPSVHRSLRHAVP
jgi:hypothetical protein